MIFLTLTRKNITVDNSYYSSAGSLASVARKQVKNEVLVEASLAVLHHRCRWVWPSKAQCAFKSPA